jgi:hypothetical protein
MEWGDKRSKKKKERQDYWAVSFKTFIPALHLVRR